jgi:hypothetical protein
MRYLLVCSVGDVQHAQPGAAGSGRELSLVRFPVFGG